MIKSIFFRALTLLGLTFVLIGCGAADPGEGGTGTPGTGAAGSAGVSMEDVTKEVEKLIRNSKGKLDTTDGVAVATKIVSIIKASQPIGSCSLFNQGIFQHVGTAAPFLHTYSTKGEEYPGGSGSLTVTTGGTAPTAAYTFAANTTIVYKYDKYSIDGIYFLDGTLTMKSTAATVATTKDVSAWTAEVSTLTLSMGSIDGTGTKDIATLKTAEAFAPAFSAVAGNVCGYSTTITVQAAAVTVTKAGEGKFATPVVLATSVAGTSTKIAEGTNVGLLMALIGPRYS